MTNYECEKTALMNVGITDIAMDRRPAQLLAADTISVHDILFCGSAYRDGSWMWPWRLVR